MPSISVVIDPDQSTAARESDCAGMLAAAPHRGTAVELCSLGAVTVGLTRHSGSSDGDRAVTGDGDLAVTGAAAAVLVGVLDEPVPGSRPDESPAAALARALAERRLNGLLAGLRGSYAAVVTDGSTTIAFRDHVGTQTIFHRLSQRRCVLATEAKQVVVGSGLPRRPDVDAVVSIFYGAYDDDTPAALDGVRRLPKATALEIGPGGATSRRYWNPVDLVEAGPRRRSAEIAEAFEFLMERAVARTLTGDDVVSLSGGVDAPTVAAFGVGAYLTRYGKPLPALSTVYPTIPSADESYWISMIAQRLDMPLETFVPSGTHLGDLTELGRLLDGPVPTVWFSEIDEYYRRASAAGYRRILSGECAEYVIEMRAGLLPYLVSRGRLRAATRFLMARRRGGARPTTVVRAALAATAPDVLVRALRKGRPANTLLDIPDFLDPSRINTADRAAATGRRQLWRDEQLEAFHGPGLSFEADAVVQDRYGLLVRRPWMDIDLWEFFLSLRAEDKFPGSRYKSLVKDLMRGRLPDEVLDRRTFTTFNEVIMSRVDYAGLNTWLRDPSWSMPGVDYHRLARRLDARDLRLPDYVWAKDLATAHAFVESTG